MPKPTVPQIIVLWERTLHSLLDCTERFPKSVRLSFGHRIDGLALDIAEALVEAQYASGAETEAFLHRANRMLARLRMLIRVAADRRYLSLGLLETLSKDFQAVGAQLNRWLRASDGA